MSIAILKPNQGHIAYTKATETFRDLYQKVIGQEIPITEADDGISDLIVIGSDSVNDFLMREVLDLNIKSLGIRYGTDDYCILTYKKDNRNVLILAGGRGRSTLYAVYDYFESSSSTIYGRSIGVARLSTMRLKNPLALLMSENRSLALLSVFLSSDFAFISTVTE